MTDAAIEFLQLLGEQTPHEYRVAYELRGRHVHCKIYSRERIVGVDNTYAKCGDITLAVAEFQSFLSRFDAEFIGDRNG